MSGASIDAARPVIVVGVACPADTAGAGRAVGGVVLASVPRAAGVDAPHDVTMTTTVRINTGRADVRRR